MAPLPPNGPFRNTSLTDKLSAVEVGRLLTADYIMTGSVIETEFLTNVNHQFALRFSFVYHAVCFILLVLNWKGRKKVGIIKRNINFSIHLFRRY